MSQPDWLARLQELVEKAKPLDQDSPEWSQIAKEIIRIAGAHSQKLKAWQDLAKDIKDIAQILGANFQDLERRARQLPDGSSEWSATTNEMIRIACASPPNSRQRRKGVNAILRIVLASPKLWKSSDPGYEEAFSRALEFCFKNLCEAETSNCPYDPDMQDGNILRWLNTTIKRRLQNEQQSQTQQRNREVSDSDYALDHYAAPFEDYDLERVQRWMATIIDLIKTDATEDFRQTHLRDRSDVTAQAVLLARIIEGLKWRQLGKRYKVAPSTLSSFYQAHCGPLLIQRCAEEGIPTKPEDFYE